MLLPIDGYSVGEHPIIARLLKGMFHVRPPEPRYSFTWDVNVLSTLLSYVARTASIRQSLNSSQVFVSHGKPTKLFYLQPSQDGLKLFCRWQELILVFLRVTVLEELRLRRQSVWEYP